MNIPEPEDQRSAFYKPRALAALVAAGFLGGATLALASEPDVGERIGQTAQATAAYVADSALTARVKVALLAQENLDSIDIDVESTDGVVTLAGGVAHKAAIELAGDVAREVKGVRSVHNMLQVSNNRG